MNTNIEIEVSLIRDGIVLKAEDLLYVEERPARVIHHGKPHTVVEKMKKDIKVRVSNTDETNNRRREDYINYKESCRTKREERLKTRPSKIHRDNMRETFEVDYFEETQRIERIRQEILDRTQRRAESLRNEAEVLKATAEKLVKEAAEKVVQAEKLEKSLAEED